MARQWCSPTEEQLQKFLAYCCAPDPNVEFQHVTLSPSAFALDQYKRRGPAMMTRFIDEETRAPSVYSDYHVLEQEGLEVACGSPRKKTRSVKRDMEESPTKPGPKLVAFAAKDKMKMAQPKALATTSSSSFVSNASLIPKTPSRQASSRDASLTSTPYNRSHTTGRKYLCARCIDANLFCCWISFSINLLQAAHLVPHYVGNIKHREHLECLRQAIGGRFSVNSRVNYLLLHQPIHTVFDKQGAIVYPIEKRVLDAVEKYLCWLDLQDGGRPWENGGEAVDYFKVLRCSHPVLCDGHQYEIRFTGLKEDKVDIILYKKYVEGGEEADIEGYARRPYKEVPTRKVFSNPILLLLNLNHQMEKTYGKERMRESWIWRREEWKKWIRVNMGHLAELKDEDAARMESDCSVDVLAEALVVGCHVRRRLGDDFEWVVEKKESEEEWDVFSGGEMSERGCGSRGGSGGRRDDGEGSKGSKRTREGSGRGNLFGAEGGRKRNEMKSTDCKAMAEEWRRDNCEGRDSMWKKVKGWKEKGRFAGIGMRLDRIFWNIVKQIG